MNEDTKWGDRYAYYGFGGCDCHCYLKVRGNVVLCTEPDDNEGTSVTNMAEALATWVCKDYSIKMEDLTWIECYPQDSQSFSHRDEDSFDLVSFTIVDRPSPYGRMTGKRFVNPKWTPADREWVKATFGV